ncbi:MAG TPA: GYDIA family GHMP kinase [Flavobacteriaceae bacterium]|nr:GHMP kinase [Flavobacteriaceae bacterium]MCB9213943.1 GHMP kinase [Alteromonas sp.]HPF11072.1 GYDIA family GHMP kinase [Flavobacteriaceae bacterium]HQU22141.1 GYDIA family GHMP kinase [Flavobacteriaceae bacterium]HQU64299.1 GYDIA family GHMP kinase [Flavobacteriaceae bacterium]
MNTFHSNGKLLLTGEYVVLDGASSLAIPTKKGQSLTITHAKKEGISWKSYDYGNALWFEAQFCMNDTVSKAANPLLFQLLSILKEAKKLNSHFLAEATIEAITHLDFPRNWGLGSSSTLINNIAQWAQVDAFQLLRNSFGGSGYDVAAAQQDGPFLFRLESENPIIEKTPLHWNFTDHVFFLHLNRKQDSKAGIKQYKSRPIDPTTISEISKLTHEFVSCTTLTEFENLIETHEEIISKTIQLPTVKEKLFKEYPHAIKSLGAWGGDFVMVVGSQEYQKYFRQKGYATLIPFQKMIL